MLLHQCHILDTLKSKNPVYITMVEMFAVAGIQLKFAKFEVFVLIVHYYLCIQKFKIQVM